VEVSQLPRHLYIAYSDEVEVAELLGCRDRNRSAALLTKLRNLGYHKNNLNAVKNDSGNLHVAYRPSQQLLVPDTTYVPCSHCYGCYRREQLWRHDNRCKVASDNDDSNVRRPLRAALYSIFHSVSVETVTSVVTGMRKGAIYMAIKDDLLIHELIRMLMSQIAHSITHINYVRRHVRNLGRLLLKMTATVPGLRNATIRDMIAPQYFSEIVVAVREIAGCDTEAYTPSTGDRDLNFCTDIMEGDLSGAESADNFEALMKSRWKYEISGGARRELQKRSFNKPLLLPLTNDVMKLTAYLKDQQAEALNVVSCTVQGDFGCEYRRLAEMILAQVILFNRRRQGEVSKLTLDIYRSHAHVASTTTNHPKLSSARLQSRKNSVTCLHALKFTARDTDVFRCYSQLK